MSSNDLMEFVTERFDKIDEKMTAGFSKMNGRVRYLEKLAYTLLGIVLMIGYYLKYLKE